MPEVAWTLFWTGLGSLTLFYLAVRENDKPIRYTVPTPKRPENVEILDEPAIKVRIPTISPGQSSKLTQLTLSVSCPGVGFYRGTMLCPCNRTAPRPREPLDDKRH